MISGDGGLSKASDPPRTAAATAARRRIGQESKAAALRQAGWLVVPPELAEELIAGLTQDLLRKLDT